LEDKCSVSSPGADYSTGVKNQKWPNFETFKIITGRDAVDHDQFFQLSSCEYKLRGHNMKL